MGDGGDEVEDLRMKSRARTAAAARHAFRKVHMVLGEDKVSVGQSCSSRDEVRDIGISMNDAYV